MAETVSIPREAPSGAREAESSHRIAEPSILIRASARRRREAVSLVLVVLYFVIVINYLFTTDQLLENFPPVAWWSMFGAAVVQHIFSRVNSRCPACDKYLASRIRTAQYCPFCGEQLQLENPNTV